MTAPDPMKNLKDLMRQISDHIDAVANAERNAKQAIGAMGNLRLSLSDCTFSSGPTEAQKAVMRSVLVNMRETVEQEHAATIREQKRQASIAIDCLRVELPRLAAKAAIELGQVAMRFRQDQEEAE